MSNKLDDDTINTLIKYLNPEREIFKEFIFRDSKGLYKYTGTYPSLIKEYLDDHNDYNFENTCKLIKTKIDDIKSCHKFFFDAILNMDSNAIIPLINKIKEITDEHEHFFDIAKDEIINIDYKVVLAILKKFGFKITEKYNEYLKKYIKVFENTPYWFQKYEDPTKKNISKIPFLIDYLQLLVDYINSNISILNENLTERDTDFLYIMNLEEYLKNTYNKNLIYNEIIRGHLSKYSGNSTVLNNFFKEFMIYEKEKKNHIFNSHILTHIINDYIEKLGNVDNTNVDLSSVFRKLHKLLRIYSESENELFETLGELVKYVMLEKTINNQDDINLDPVENKFVLDKDFAKKEFDLFLKLKQHLIEEQREFLKKYPRKYFYN